MSQKAFNHRVLFSAFPVLIAALTTNAVDFDDSTGPVGRFGPNRCITPVNQLITPAGTLVELPGMRPQALALSPDGKNCS